MYEKVTKPPPPAPHTATSTKIAPDVGVYVPLDVNTVVLVGTIPAPEENVLSICHL